MTGESLYYWVVDMDKEPKLVDGSPEVRERETKERLR